MSSDFHLHTLVSDGVMAPDELLRRAAACGVTRLSITDHDALGAYRWRDGAVFAEAQRLGLTLTVGIEMDAGLDGMEVHLLGFDVALDDPALDRHLAAVRAARSERARQEIGVVNGLLGEGTIREEDVFAPGRETLMKPHFIHPILDKGLFPTYEDANAWYRENVKTNVRVPKPTLAEAIALVRGAGGWTALAHPGYYARGGLPVLERLPGLAADGLQGVEVDYPYHACSPRQFTAGEERAFVDELRDRVTSAGLIATRGSDAHTPEDLSRVYGSR